MASKYLKYKSDPFKSTPGVKSYGVKNFAEVSCCKTSSHQNLHFR